MHPLPVQTFTKIISHSVLFKSFKRKWDINVVSNNVADHISFTSRYCTLYAVVYITITEKERKII